MTQLSTLDTAEINHWLTRVTQTIDRGLRDQVRTEALAPLRADLDVHGGLAVLTQLALLDDCLRVAHLAIEADGRVDPDELARVSDLVGVAATKYFQVLPGYESFDEGAASSAEVARFLDVHRRDTGAFGYANARPWRGVELARHVDRHTRNAAPLRDHERMLVRILDAVFDGRATKVEHDVRRSLRDLFEPPAAVGLDPRAAAFCRPDAPEVFSSVAHGSQIHERDPFDVEAIHAEAREVFHRLLVRATTPEQHQHGHGRTLLVLGESGAGKTHLLRALRYQVHSQRLGYVGYMQMTTEVGDYARYVLRNFIDSLEHPYDAPALAESCLMYLSDGLAEGRADLPRVDIDRLREEVLAQDELATLIGGMVDRILRTEGLGHLEPDLVHALLLLQRRDAAVQRRVVRFLRCEPLNAYEQRLLGGLAPRDQPEDPMRTIRQLGTIAYELQLAALVLLIDQVEDTIPDGKTSLRLQQAVDVLRGIADAVPSAIVVISCLDDVYTAIRPHLSRSLIDRLERDPAPVRLASQRQREEIEEMLIKRLDHLYSTFDVAIQDDDPLYPFTPEQLDAVDKLRARDAIARFRDLHETCIRTGTTGAPSAASEPAVASPASPPAPDLDRAWNDALSASGGIPDDDAGVLELVAEALRGAAEELAIELIVRREQDQLVVEGKALARRVIAMCNRQPQGGHLGNQLEALRALAKAGVVPIALRNSDFQFKPKSKISKQVGELVAAGGRTVVLEEGQLRAVAAARVLASAHPQVFETWRAHNRPITHLGFIRAILELDSVPRAVSRTDTQPIPEPRPPARPAPRLTGPIAAVDPAQLRLGVTLSARKEPVLLDVDRIKRHVAVLGTSGSGKTTAALCMLEQLLERGISVLLVDRKGDLARYASEAWWRAPGDEAERRMALREQIDLALFTPGAPHGRPLRLPVIPPLADASTQDRDQLARFAASGLAAMMGYGNGSAFQKKQAVLQCAIQLHAGERDVTLEILRDTINQPDPELLVSVGPLQRYFAQLAEDLQSLGIQRGSLLAGEGEPLELAALLPPPGARPKLSIISTTAFAEVPVLQFWVSRLLIELSRLARTRPHGTLQGVVFLDEADAYIPAQSSPPTKEPMFDLLKRARSGGLGIVLATQNPADFDYKARDLIDTWLVGKVSQDRAIEKMRNLLSSYPNVASRLANQSPGQFFVLGSGAKEITCDRSLMTTEQLSEQEIVELARDGVRLRNL
jgi:DNA helicase HerA-like ATPase/energy-coupling factor transporter ATP-binding protein EcfA2